MAALAVVMYAKDGFVYITCAMIYPLSLSQHTLYAELLEQGADDLFDPDWPENGSLLIRPNRAGAQAYHAYYQGYRPAAGNADRSQRYARYLGRADDPEVAATIERFQRVKAVRAERTTTVRALIGVGMPRPDRITGRIIEALARASLFPDNAVLLGDAAYQTYDGVLGVRLSGSRTTATPNRPEVAVAIRDHDRRVDILVALRTVDPSFDEKPPGAATYRSRDGVRFSAILASEDSAALTAFLIDQPVRSIVLHGSGIPVTVPAPERYAAYAQVQQFSPCLEEVSALITSLTHVGRDHALVAASAEAAALGAGGPA